MTVSDTLVVSREASAHGYLLKEEMSRFQQFSYYQNYSQFRWEPFARMRVSKLSRIGANSWQ
jgi:hypothetical protein